MNGHYGRHMGYLVSVYCLDGYTQPENQGWDKDYNFGATEAVEPRWRARNSRQAGLHLHRSI